MSAEEQFDRNRKYYIALQCLTRLMEEGVINRAQLRRGNRYYAEMFEATIRLYV